MGWLSERDKASIVETLNVTANATLTKIQRPGVTDDYAETTPGTEVWNGEALCYLSDTTTDENTGQRQSTTDEWLLTILDAGGAPIADPGPRWSGHIVTVDDRRSTPAVERQLRVIGSEHNDNDLLDSSVLRLEVL